MKKVLLLVGFSVFLCSCSNTFFSSLNTVASDPIITTPLVLSGKISNSIVLTWDKDPGADEYTILKKSKLVNEQAVEVYRGSINQFTDTNTSSESSYFYSLAKRKGQKWFNQSSFVMGYSSSILIDKNEPDNSIEEAKKFVSGFQFTLPFYYNSGVTISDDDFFYVDVDPHRQYQITITPITIPASADDIQIAFAVENNTESILSSTSPQTIFLTNISDFIRRIYFHVYIINNYTKTTNYGQTFTYQLAFSQIIKTGI